LFTYDFSVWDGFGILVHACSCKFEIKEVYGYITIKTGISISLLQLWELRNS